MVKYHSLLIAFIFLSVIFSVQVSACSCNNNSSSIAASCNQSSCTCDISCTCDNGSGGTDCDRCDALNKYLCRPNWFPSSSQTIYYVSILVVVVILIVITTVVCYFCNWCCCCRRKKFQKKKPLNKGDPIGIDPVEHIGHLNLAQAGVKDKPNKIVELTVKADIATEKQSSPKPPSPVPQPRTESVTEKDPHTSLSDIGLANTGSINSSSSSFIPNSTTVSASINTTSSTITPPSASDSDPAIPPEKNTGTRNSPKHVASLSSENYQNKFKDKKTRINSKSTYGAPPGPSASPSETIRRGSQGEKRSLPSSSAVTPSSKITTVISKNSPFSAEEEAKFLAFRPITDHIDKLDEFFKALNQSPRTTWAYLLEDYVFLALSSNALKEVLVTKWYDWIFPLFMLKDTNQKLMEPKEEKQLLQIVTAVFSEVLYYEFERRTPVVEKQIKNLLLNFMNIIQDFAWTPSTIRIVRLLLHAFLNLIHSKVKVSNSWRMNVMDAQWQNFFDILTLIEEFLFLRPTHTKLKCGMHLSNKGNADSKLVDVVVDILETLNLSSLDSQDDNSKLRSMYKKMGLEELQYYHTITAYFFDLQCYASRLTNEGEISPLEDKNQQSLAKLFLNRKAFKNNKDMIKDVFDGAEQEIKQYHNTQYMQAAINFATMQETKEIKSTVAYEAEDEMSREDAQNVKEQCNDKTSLGEGSFGRVFRVQYYGIPYACKIIKVERGRERFVKAEINVLRTLRARRCVMFRAAYTKGPDILILTEFCEGGSLHERIHDEKQGPLSDYLRFKFAFQIAEGLVEMHHQPVPIVHRDLKPSNVLIDDHEDVKLCDFGFAHTVNQSAITQTSEGMAHSRAGTDLYKAPEVWDPDAKSGCESDVYSFGIVLHELFCGEPPWWNKTKEALYTLITQQKQQPPIDPLIYQRYPKVATIIEQCTRYIPSKRLSTLSLVNIFKSLLISAPSKLSVSQSVAPLSPEDSPTHRNTSAHAPSYSTSSLHYPPTNSSPVDASSLAYGLNMPAAPMPSAVSTPVNSRSLSNLQYQQLSGVAELQQLHQLQQLRQLQQLQLQQLQLQQLQQLQQMQLQQTQKRLSVSGTQNEAEPPPPPPPEQVSGLITPLNIVPRLSHSISPLSQLPFDTVSSDAQVHVPMLGTSPTSSSVGDTLSQPVEPLLQAIQSLHSVASPTPTTMSQPLIPTPPIPTPSIPTPSIPTSSIPTSPIPSSNVPPPVSVPFLHPITKQPHQLTITFTTNSASTTV